jgi:hypothetical protein
LLVDAGTEDISDALNILNNYSNLYNIWALDPAGGAWTWTDIDNLKIGFGASSPSVDYADATLTLRPNAAGDKTELSVNPAVANYLNVDEETPDDDSTYVYYSNSTSAHEDLYNVPNHTSESGTINKVRIYIRAATANALYNHYARTHIKTHSVEYTGSDNLLTESYQNFYTEYTTNPNTSIAWTWTEVDNLQVGVQLQCNTSTSARTKCTQVYAVVYYTPTSTTVNMKCTQCYAVVNYTPTASTVSLNNPDSVTVGHSRKIKRHLFADGKYEVLDIGRAKKTLVLTGKEWETSDTKMNTLKTMTHYGKYVTLSGLDDTNLNTDYYIVDFNFTRKAGEPIIYNWSLTLEEA